MPTAAYYYSKQWHPVAPSVTGKGRVEPFGPKKQARLGKPLYRPSWIVEFSDPTCEEVKAFYGKVLFVILNVEDGETFYEIACGYTRHRVSESCIAGRLVRTDE